MKMGVFLVSVALTETVSEIVRLEEWPDSQHASPAYGGAHLNNSSNCSFFLATYKHTISITMLIVCLSFFSLYEK